jgi:hypothetical protein
MTDRSNDFPGIDVIANRARSGLFHAQAISPRSVLCQPWIGFPSEVAMSTAAASRKAVTRFYQLYLFEVMYGHDQNSSILIFWHEGLPLCFVISCGL